MVDPNPSVAPTVSVVVEDEPQPDIIQPSLGPPPQYWVRVHGYPSEVESEAGYYNDFYDWQAGPLRGDPRDNLHSGDQLILYADGPASIYALATITGEPEGP